MYFHPQIIFFIYKPEDNLTEAETCRSIRETDVYDKNVYIQAFLKSSLNRLDGQLYSTPTLPPEITSQVDTVYEGGCVRVTACVKWKERKSLAPVGIRDKFTLGILILNL
jgi:hypothetical protein